MRMMHYTIFAALLLTAADAAAQENTSCGVRRELRVSTFSEARLALERALSVLTPQQSYLFRASSLRETVCDRNLQFVQSWADSAAERPYELLPVQASAVNNSAYARSVNDAAAWNGAGYTLSAAAGVRASWRAVHAQVAPSAHYMQNRDFTFVRAPEGGRAAVANPYHPGIDYPTRPGTGSSAILSPGQSYVQAVYRNFSATLGTENLWIGAADRYPILMSYTAEGFPHLRLGTQRPIDLKVVRLEFQMVFASLNESEYFDGQGGNDNHYFGVSMVTLEPTFLPGFYISAMRAVHDSADALGHGPGFYLSRNVRTFFGSYAGGNLRSDNGLGLVLARWVHPASGFEAYAEWSREDTPGGWLDVLREPDWTQAYVLGVQKIFVSPQRLTRLYGELIHLTESNPARAGRGFFSYYTHSTVQQGHTNRGQLLGAAIGPGSDAQLIGVDIFGASGRSAFTIERTRYDDDTYYRTFARRWGETRHDAEINLSASRMQMFGNFEVEGGIMFSRRYGRQFIPLAAEGPDLIEENWQLRVSGAWRP